MPSTRLTKFIFTLSLTLFIGAIGMIIYAIGLGPEAEAGGYWFSFGDVINQFVVAMLGLAGLSFTFFTTKKKETEPKVVENTTNINSEGAAVYTGDIAPKGDFVGRDKITYIHHSQPKKKINLDPKTAWEQFHQIPTDLVPDQGSIPAGSYFSMPKNPQFVGRKNQLIKLAKLLTQENQQTIAIAATGLGGIGKTQLAVEFCHRYGQYFGGGVYWLNFESEETARTDLAQVALLLNEEWQGLTIDEQITMVLNGPEGWTADIPRLLIFDNLEDPQLLRKYKPTRGGCSIILTSRRGSWERTGIEQLTTLPLGVLDRNESIALIQKMAPHIAKEEADKIANELGDLPLALHVAGTYLDLFAESVSFDEYLAQIQGFSTTGELGKQAADIEAETLLSPTNHTWHVGRTFRLSYDQLLKTDSEETNSSNSNNIAKRIARRLLSRTGVFAPGTPVPIEMLFETFDKDEDSQNQDKDTPLEKKDLQKGIHLLVRLGLLDLAYFSEEQGVMIHRLIADFTQTVSDPTELKNDISVAKKSLSHRCNRINNAGYPRKLLPYHIHLYHILDHPLIERDVVAAGLLNTFGFNLDSMGELSAAKPYYEQALQIWRDVLGDQHPNTASSLNNMGHLLQAMGELSAAKPYYEQALQIYRDVLGDQHPDTAISLNNMGGLLQAMGELSAAKPYYEQALAIFERALGPDHPNTNIVRRNLESLN
jgi:tetratricopeptide (TPR) repeat protein